jgi:perosamine synthetase
LNGTLIRAPSIIIFNANKTANMIMKNSEVLAIHGGPPVREDRMPPRYALGPDEIAELHKAIDFYKDQGEDPPYQGPYEKKFCDAFSAFMGGGYTDAVSAGTAGIYVGLKALQLPAGSEVMISPVTDSGPLNCIIEQGLVPVVVDSAPDSYNVGLQQFIDRATANTSAFVIIHAGGEPVPEIVEIATEAKKRGIKLLEDCAQAIGAEVSGDKAGRFGDIAAFSTMYRKNLAAGASSGLVYAMDKDIYDLALSYADRGKPVWRSELDLRNPGHAFFPALNWNADDLSCAIGLANLRRLDDTNERRRAFLRELVKRLDNESHVCRPYAYHEGFAPFYFPVFVDPEMITCTKIEFAEAVAAEGIGLGEHYGCLVSTWEWAQPYLSDDFVTTNALSTRDRCFHLYVNENYGEPEVNDTVAAIRKVEAYFMK